MHLLEKQSDKNIVLFSKICTQVLKQGIMSANGKNMVTGTSIY